MAIFKEPKSKFGEKKKKRSDIKTIFASEPLLHYTVEPEEKCFCGFTSALVFVQFIKLCLFLSFGHFL